MPRPLLVLGFTFLLLACSSTSTRPLRLVDCTRTAYCSLEGDWPEMAWSAEHEALYWQGVRSIVHGMACGQPATKGRKLAYIAKDSFPISCAANPAPIHHVKDRDQGNRLLAAGEVDHVVAFERANASGVKGDIEVPVSVSFYGRSKKSGVDSRLEGMDNYIIVKTNTITEVRLISRAAHE